MWRIREVCGDVDMKRPGSQPCRRGWGERWLLGRGGVEGWGGAPPRALCGSRPSAMVSGWGWRRGGSRGGQGTVLW